ncbi:MAG: hypothetical protein N2595_08535 [bacterium]|nr:hypothetical protein [bacterium]
MNVLLRLSVLPLLGIGFIATSIYLNWAQLRLRVAGEKIAGQVAGMAIVRGVTNDVIFGIDTEVEMTYETGLGTRLLYKNYKVDAAWTVMRDGVAEPLPTDDVSGEILQLAEEVARRSAERIREILKRESRKRRGNGERVVRIIKTETARGYLNVGKIHPVLDWDEKGIRPTSRGGQTPTTGFVRTHAVFDMRDMALVQSNKGEMMVGYAQTRNWELHTPSKQNFVLYCEPYTTEFRPVFAYEVSGRRYARLSHIGRHGGPTLALVLFGPCWVYYDKNAPERAVLIANPGRMEGGILAWFSRLCEGVFAQWGSGALIVMVGLFCLVSGLIQISLAIWPSKRLTSESK